MTADWFQRLLPLKISPPKMHTPAVGTDAVVTLPATPNISWCIYGIGWSYNGDPASGQIIIEDGAGENVFMLDVTSGGPACLSWLRPLQGEAGNLVRITLKTGGATILGKLNVLAVPES